MRGKEQLREFDRGRNIENGTLLISQLIYECVIDKLFVVYHVIWTMELIFHRFSVWSICDRRNLMIYNECQAPYRSRYWNPK